MPPPTSATKVASSKKPSAANLSEPNTNKTRTCDLDEEAQRLIDLPTEREPMKTMRETLGDPKKKKKRKKKVVIGADGLPEEVSTNRTMSEPNTNTTCTMLESQERAALAKKLGKVRDSEDDEVEWVEDPITGHKTLRLKKKHRGKPAGGPIENQGAPFDQVQVGKLGQSGSGKHEFGAGPSPINYPDFLDRHYQHLGTGSRIAPYKIGEIFTLLNDARSSLSKQRALVDVATPIFLVGDIHGQFNDLINIFVTLGRPPHRRYLFLGDYVDRGTMSLQCICLLLAYKVQYPTHVYILRGNHECSRINKVYGFYDEIKCHYGTAGRKLWLMFQKVFDEMPIYGLVDNKILGMHGGISPSMTDLDTLRKIPKPIRNPTQGMVNDALWSDPDHLIKGWQPSPRGTSFSFGEDIATIMCQRLGVELIARAHQVCMDGYWFFAGKRLVTIFSAPNYCGAFPNAGAVMEVNEDLICTFHLFSPWEEDDDNYRRVVNPNQYGKNAKKDKSHKGKSHKGKNHKDKSHKDKASAKLEEGPVDCDDVA